MRQRPTIIRVVGNRRGFGVFLLGAAASSIGTWAQSVAGIILVFQLTGDTFVVGFVTVAQYVSGIVITPFAGVLVDRFDRRTVLAWCQVGGLIPSVTLGIIGILGEYEIWQIIAATAVIGMFASVQAPASLTLTPSLVSHWERATALSLISSQFNLARAIGPVVASAITLTAGPALAFLVNGGTYLLYLVALAFVRPRPRRQIPQRVSLRGTTDALRRNPLVAVLLALGLVIMGSADAVLTLGPARVSSLGLPAEWAGVFVSGFGVGAVVMALFLLPALQSRESLLLPALLGLGISLATFATAPSSWLALIGAVASGAFFLAAANRALTTIQGSVHSAVLGRVTAVWVLAVAVGRVTYAALGGLLATTWGATVAGVAIAATAVAAGVCYAWYRHRRRD